MQIFDLLVLDHMLFFLWEIAKTANDILMKVWKIILKLHFGKCVKEYWENGWNESMKWIVAYNQERREKNAKADRGVMVMLTLYKVYEHFNRENKKRNGEEK